MLDRGAVYSITVSLLTLGMMATSPVHSAPADATTVKSSPDVIIYRGVYPGWPWVAATPSGKLVCVWREGTEHVFSSNGRLMLGESEDQGKTWSKARVFHDEPNVDDRNVAILILSESDWLVCYNTDTSKQSRVFTLRSKDAGQTWSKPRPVCDLHARTRSAPIKLSTGRLVLPFYRAPGDQSLVALSDDDGETWKVVELANVEGFVGDEWDICEMPDRRLVGIIRNSAPNNGGWFYKTESRDGGKTWARAVKTNLRDSRSTSPAQIFLHASRPVVLYSDARMVSVAMATTDDPDLVTWNVEQRLPCYRYRADGKPILDSSYPVSASIGGNKRFIVDYQHDGDDHLVTGYFVELPAKWSRSAGR